MTSSGSQGALPFLGVHPRPSPSSGWAPAQHLPGGLTSPRPRSRAEPALTPNGRLKAAMRDRGQTVEVALPACFSGVRPRLLQPGSPRGGLRGALRITPAIQDDPLPPPPQMKQRKPPPRTRLGPHPGLRAGPRLPGSQGGSPRGVVEPAVGGPALALGPPGLGLSPQRRYLPGSILGVRVEEAPSREASEAPTGRPTDSPACGSRCCSAWPRWVSVGPLERGRWLRECRGATEEVGTQVWAPQSTGMNIGAAGQGLCGPGAAFPCRNL